MDQIQKEIIDLYNALMERLPEEVRSGFLLTGGAAAFLYGSDRPFSHDVDLMVSKEEMPRLQKLLGLEFGVHKSKPVFHSEKAILQEGGHSYDLIAESIVEPEGQNVSCAFKITPEIEQRKRVLSLGGQKIALIPKELLVLIKLLAGRERTLGKYDLYDARKIVESSPDFDWTFFKELVRNFCQPLKKTIPILVAHAGQLKSIRLLEVLESLQQSD